MQNAIILSIGNELLIGDTVNTNASWIGRFLTEQGFRVRQVVTLSDDPDEIRHAVRQGLSMARLVVTTGGMGPTHDDITKKVVAGLVGRRLVTDDRVLEAVKQRAEARGLVFTPARQEQALVPEGSLAFPNPKGTAPGIWIEQQDSALVMLPGVPYEMKALMEGGIREQIARFFPEREVFATHYMKSAGVAESTLSDEVIGRLDSWLEGGNGVAYLPSPSGVTIRVSRSGDSAEQAEEALKPLADFIRGRAGGFIYGEGREATLSEALGSLLRTQGLTIAIAESCTGGLVSDLLTDIPGSSDYVLGGITAYADQVKRDLLGVPAEVLERHGAVSGEVALKMAEGVAGRLGADIGISATGIAGPGGGSEEKPVGLVWTGYWIRGEHFALRSQFGEDRRINKIRTATLIMETVRRKLLGIEPLPYGLEPFRP